MGMPVRHIYTSVGYYRTDLIVNLFYSNNSNIDSYDISYIENGIPKNEIVTKSELKPITLTGKILKELKTMAINII